MAAPALVLLLFAFPPSTPLDFLTSAPIASTIFLLALAALADFCADLWRLRTAQQDERRFLPSTLTGMGVATGLIRLERSARWRGFRRRGEWLFVPLWLTAVLWIHDEAALPVVAGALLALVVMLFFRLLAGLDGERRERRIADSAMRAAASLGLARLLGRFTAFAESSIVRNARARRAERELAILSATCLLCLRFAAAATLVLFLLYALSLVGSGQASVGELVAILLLLRTLFFWLEQRARALSFYAPPQRRGDFITLVPTPTPKTETPLSQQQDEATESFEAGGESASVPILQVERGEVFSAAQILLTCDALLLQQGEAIALAGESASGKSLLLQACAGLVESKGFRLGGGDIDASASISSSSSSASSSPSSLFWASGGVCYVPQEAALLDGSLGENIASFRAPCDEAKAMELLVLLGAERTLARLPDGLATRTDPFDTRLPYTFKVQVLLAAALYLEPRLLLCDASIDALDAKGSERFARVLKTFCKKDASERSAFARAAVVVTRQSALLQVCHRAWICADNRVRVQNLTTRQERKTEE